MIPNVVWSVNYYDKSREVAPLPRPRYIVRCHDPLGTTTGRPLIGRALLVRDPHTLLMLPGAAWKMCFGTGPKYRQRRQVAWMCCRERWALQGRTEAAARTRPTGIGEPSPYPTSTTLKLFTPSLHILRGVEWEFNMAPPLLQVYSIA